MAFTGWENVKPGEEFSIEEITAFYGNIGPYSMMERPHRSLWGRCPMVVRAITKAAIPGRFAAGEKVLAFLKQEGSNCSVAAFPEAMFKEENFDMRSFVAAAEMQSLRNTPHEEGGAWTEQYSARLFVQPYCPSLRELTPPYEEADMEGVFRALAEKHGAYADFALASEIFSTGSEKFPRFAFALASKPMGGENSPKLWDAWDVVLLFFNAEADRQAIAAPLRSVAFWDQPKLKLFADGLFAQ